MIKRIIALILLFIGAALLTGCAQPSSTEPVDLTGDWSYSSDSVNFEANVEGDEIQINLIMDNSEGLYWTGSFSKDALNGDTIISHADVEALDASLLGSGDEQKTFLFKDGTLVFSFTIVGTTQDIVLKR